MLRKKFYLAKHRLHTGLGSDLERIETAAELALARDSLLEALATYRIAEINLAHSMGRVEQLTEGIE